MQAGTNLIELPWPPASLSGHNIPEQTILHRLLDYDPTTGRFHWRPRGEVHFDAQFAGKEAFTTVASGYLGGNLLQRRVKAHRVAFKYVYGRDADGEVDHINGNRTDNRISNLREATRTENARNLCTSKRNQSGAVGVCFRSDRAKWRAYIRANGRQIFLGYFSTKAGAVAARKAAEREYGYHPNHGRAA